MDIHGPAGFELAIPVSQRPQTHALEWAATGIDSLGFECVTFWLVVSKDTINPC
jgi:hypothetical protein